MKKLCLLLCSLFFMSALATQAICPCEETIPVNTCCCETPAPCCETPKPCCAVPNETVIKKESCCWQMTQIQLFNCLCLNQCQMEKACCIYNKYVCDSKEIKDRLNCEKARLCQMIKGCCSKCEIKAQEKKIKEIKKELKDRFACYEDQLKELLSKKQLKEYKRINKQENSKYKKLIKNNCCCK